MYLPESPARYFGQIHDPVGGLLRAWVPSTSWSVDGGTQVRWYFGAEEDVISEPQMLEYHESLGKQSQR